MCTSHVPLRKEPIMARQNTPANPLTDINGDGFTDFFDYTAFVTLFEIGC